ncbi:MAG: tripartite tricarboxylate transporter substrate-binding protein, partial [Xanthobacteraceae bacterium]
IPTVGEFLSHYEASAWNGVGAPKNTPAEIIDRLNEETRRSRDQGAVGRLRRCSDADDALPNSASSLRTKPKSGAR